MCIRDRYQSVITSKVHLVKNIKIAEAIIDTFNSLFSINNFIVGPKFPIKNATKKNLEPLVNKEIIIKYIRLKCINPLLIVNSLKGTGEKPAIASKVNQAMVPPSEETLSFQKDGSTP